MECLVHGDVVGMVKPEATEFSRKSKREVEMRAHRKCYRLPQLLSYLLAELQRLQCTRSLT
jgi:hypothetical protein